MGTLGFSFAATGTEKSEEMTRRRMVVVLRVSMAGFWGAGNVLGRYGG